MYVFIERKKGREGERIYKHLEFRSYTMSAILPNNLSYEMCYIQCR